MMINIDISITITSIMRQAMPSLPVIATAPTCRHLMLPFSVISPCD